MLNIGFSKRLAANAIQHRATHVSGGLVVYTLADRSAHVCVTTAEWNAIGDWFDEEAGAIVRKANWLAAAIVPGVILFAIVVGSFVPSLAGAGILAGLFFGPTVIYLWHSRKIEAVATRVDAEMSRCPRVSAPLPDPRRPPRWLDIACLLLVGPGLVVAAIGQAGGPDTFRNTPLSGSGFGPVAWAALVVLVARLLWPRLVRR